MSTTYTAKLQLGKPATADRTWNVPLNANTDALEALSPLASLNVRLAEIPSASLNIAVSAGNFRSNSGAITNYAGTTSQAIPASSTRSIWLTNAAVLTLGSSYPSTPHVRLATIVTGASTITSITDDRVTLESAGSGPTFGTATLVAGTVTVSASQVTASSVIQAWLKTVGGTVGWLRISAQTAGTGFVITSTSSSDTSVVQWSIMEP